MLRSKRNLRSFQNFVNLWYFVYSDQPYCMKPLSLAIAAFIVLITVQVSYCQQKDSVMTDSLVKKFNFYKSKKQHGILYAHFDKNVYTNNENVWFTAYLLDNASSKNDVLSAVLVNDKDHLPILQEKFTMAHGIAFGNIFLPDSLQSGNYSFLLYANMVIDQKPADVFIQPITLKNTSQVTLKVSLGLLDTEKFPKDSIRRVLLTVNTIDGKLVSGASIKYSVGSITHPFITGTTKTDKSGENIFKIPADRVSLGENMLQAQVTRSKEKVDARLILPVQDNPLSIHFYPEGGLLSDEVKSLVGWEAKDAVGKPHRVNAVLYCDNKAIDTVSTSDYGMGRFTIIPSAGKHYYMKLLEASHNDSTGLAPSRQPTTTAVIRPAGRSTDVPGPQPVSSRIQSPDAVPRAKVTRIANQ